MTSPLPGSERPVRVSRERGRGWLLSLAAMLTWAAVLTLVLLITAGPPDPDALYYLYSPMLVTVVLFGTPLTYLVGWRRPRPYREVVLFALPVFVGCAAFALQA